MPKTKVICCIQAFDCEKTIEAAMESVRNQSYENWLCFVLSNGNQNTPGTPNNSFSAIRNAAVRDRRFVVVNKRENDLRMYERMLGYLADSFPDSYLCTLDADDEYAPDFFARGMALAEEYDLDIVACGTELIQKEQAGDREGTLIRRRQLEKDLIVPQERFTGLFPTYKPFFNEIWGKLYRAKVCRNYSGRSVVGEFLPDSIFTLGRLSKSQAVGVLSGTSHKFFQYTWRPMTNATFLANAAAAESQTRRLGKMRFSVYHTYKIVMDFLQQHGEIDKAVYEYTQALLFGWFGDYFARTLLPIQNEAVIAALASRLVFHPKFDELMSYRDSGRYDNLRNYQQRMEFCERLRYMLIAQKMVRNREVLWRKGLACTSATERKLDRVIARLEKTIQAVSKRRREEAV